MYTDSESLTSVCQSLVENEMKMRTQNTCTQLNQQIAYYAQELKIIREQNFALKNPKQPEFANLQQQNSNLKQELEQQSRQLVNLKRVLHGEKKKEFVQKKLKSENLALKEDISKMDHEITKLKNFILSSKAGEWQQIRHLFLNDISAQLESTIM